MCIGLYVTNLADGVHLFFCDSCLFLLDNLTSLVVLLLLIFEEILQLMLLLFLTAAILLICGWRRYICYCLGHFLLRIMEEQSIWIAFHIFGGVAPLLLIVNTI